ncbi:MAG: flagellar biosynthesis anti-sigma factor FlgM [Anaerolineae bacterium]
MIDKIQPNSSSTYTNGIQRVEGKHEVSQTKVGAINQPAAQVSWSEDALAIQRIHQAVKEAPDVRTDVVQAVRAKLEAGVYRVDAEALAGKLLPFLK